MSRLALRGRNLMGDSEFVPIVPVSKRGKEDFPVELENNTGNISNVGASPEEILPNDYSVSMGTGQFNDMYSKLSEISKLNSQMDPANKYKTLKSNFDNEMNANKLEAILDDESEFLK
jgi:hypothetical protein